MDAFARARRESFNRLNVVRKSELVEDRMRYCEANQVFRETCVRKRKEYYENIASRLKEVTYRKDWWRLASTLKNKTFKVSTNIGSSGYSFQQ